jgi:hypothetical protein
MKPEYFLLLACLAIALAVVVTFRYYYIIVPKREKERLKQAKLDVAASKAQRLQARELVYPALDPAPHPACGLAPDISKRLQADDELISYRDSFMICEVVLDGEVAFGPFEKWLEGTSRVRIRRLSDLESVACRHTHQSWIVRFVEPLQSRVYQRHADGNWNLVRVGTGMF